jgi:hypothetical protein
METIPTCNVTVDGQKYHASAEDTLKGLGSTVGVMFDVYGMATGCCCFLLFLILALTSQGPTNAGTVIVYICLLCFLLSTIASTYNYFKHKSELDSTISKGRPCKDDKGNTVK